MKSVSHQCDMMREINPRVLLYWDSADISPIVTIVEAWQKHCGSNVTLLNFDSARDFLEDNYGSYDVKLFSSCAIPAMRSDFIRMAYVLRMGGSYFDLNYVPIRKPGFMSDETTITLVRWWHGHIVNGIFYSVAGSPLLQKFYDTALERVSSRRSNDIQVVVGAKMWREILASYDTSEYSVALRSEMIKKDYINLKSSPGGRGTSNHWSEQQKFKSIFVEN